MRTSTWAAVVLAGGFALLLVVALAPLHSGTKVATAADGATSCYLLEPQPDITAYETALAFRALLGKQATMDELDAQSPGIRRHFAARPGRC